jgi:hypothetical protein
LNIFLPSKPRLSELSLCIRFVHQTPGCTSPPPHRPKAEAVVISYHFLAHPQVANGGDGLQMGWVAATILRNKSQAADSVWSSILRVGRRCKSLPP